MLFCLWIIINISMNIERIIWFLFGILFFLIMHIWEIHTKWANAAKSMNKHSIVPPVSVANRWQCYCLEAISSSPSPIPSILHSPFFSSLNSSNDNPILQTLRGDSQDSFWIPSSYHFMCSVSQWFLLTLPLYPWHLSFSPLTIRSLPFKPELRR